MVGASLEVEDLSFLEVVVSCQEEACPLAPLVQGAFPLEGPWEVSFQVEEPSCLEEVPLDPLVGEVPLGLEDIVLEPLQCWLWRQQLQQQQFLFPGESSPVGMVLLLLEQALLALQEPGALGHQQAHLFLLPYLSQDLLQLRQVGL